MKKVLALVLVAIMAVGMVVPATAASTNPKPVALVENLGNGYGTRSYADIRTSNGNVVGISYYTSGQSNYSDGYLTGNYYSTVSYNDEIRPNDEVDDYINLYIDMFEWENGYPSYAFLDYHNTWPLPSGYTLVNVNANGYGELQDASGNILYRVSQTLAAKEIRAGKIGVRTSVASGSKAIENVSIDTKIGAIEIQYVDEYISTKELDFEFTVYLTFDGKRYTDYGLTFVGTLENEIIEVYEDDDYVDTSYGAVAHAQEFVKAIEVDLGNGVSIHTKFFKDKKYYGTSTRDPDEEDDVVFAKYPDVDNVVTLKTVGLNSTGDIVKLDTDYSDYYVYDINMNYLGQSNEMLPYSTKYYLANRKLDIVDDGGSDVDDGSAPIVEGDGGGYINPETGGDDIAASNPNANPGTGR